MSALSKLIPRVCALLEYDAAAYDLTAHVATRPSYVRRMRTKERERRAMIVKLKYAAEEACA